MTDKSLIHLSKQALADYAAAVERARRYVDRIRVIAKENGYALGIHGSLTRDLDLIAIPWSVEAVCAQDLADAIKDGMGLIDSETSPSPNPEVKPWGRLGWALVGCPAPWKYVDLSIAPRAGEAVPVVHWRDRP
jgi:hypothetical protein